MNNKIRICHICSYYDDAIFHNIVTAQKGFSEPTVFFFRPNHTERMYDASDIDEVNCFSDADRLFFFLKEKKVYDTYKKLYQDRDFDLNYAHSLFVNGYIAYKVRQERHIPYIVMVQNTDLNLFLRYRRYLREVGLKVALDAERVVFASECYKNRFLSEYVPKEHRAAISQKAIVIPYSIEDIFFSDTVPSKTLSGNSRRVLSVGLICENKNQIAVCKAVEKLRAEGEDIQLTVIGKVQNPRIAKELARHPFVRVVPFLKKDALKQAYREHDLFVLASKTETFGLVYAEALSQGLPILYSKGEGFDSQFEEGHVGFSVDPRNVNDIAEGIRRVIEAYPSLAKNTVPAAERFRTALIAERYHSLYTEVERETQPLQPPAKR